MFAIGNSLREARTRRGLSAADVQKGLRIRERYLTALEEERWELLPGEAYTKSFLRMYAEFLGLDGNLYIDEYNARIAAHSEEPLVPQTLASTYLTKRGVLRTLLGILVLGAVVAGLAAWGMGGLGAGSPTASTAGAPLHVAAAAAASAPVVKTTQAVAPPTETTRITASRGRCWLLVRTGGPGGQILFQGVLAQGQTLRYPLGRRLWVRMGRPGNVDISLGGHRVNGLPAQPGNVLLTRDGAQAA